MTQPSKLGFPQFIHFALRQGGSQYSIGLMVTAGGVGATRALLMQFMGISLADALLSTVTSLAATLAGLWIGRYLVMLSYTAMFYRLARGLRHLAVAIVETGRPATRPETTERRHRFNERASTLCVHVPAPLLLVLPVLLIHALVELTASQWGTTPTQPSKSRIHFTVSNGPRGLP